MIRPGYKRTEIGLIPDDWTVDLLLGKVELLSGQHVLVEKYNSQGVGAPYLTGPADFKDGKSAVSKWTQEKRIEAEQHDVLITVKGSGAGSTFRLDIPGAVISRQFMAVKSKSIIQDYLFYIFKKEEKNLSSRAVGNLIPGLNRNDILSLVVPLPSRKEQHAIAEALSDVDSLIASLEKLIAKKRDIKTATMQQLLTGKKRLPGFGEGKGCKQTELGEIPEDWKILLLGDVIKIRHGKSQHEIVIEDGNFPILATGGEIGRTNIPLYREPSVLIGRKGTIDQPKYMDTPFWTVDTLFYSEISKSADPKFVFYKFLLIDWRSYNEASGVPKASFAA